MKGVKNFIKKSNDSLCSQDGLLNGWCDGALNGENKSYLLMAMVALFVQYGLPIVIIFLVIPLVLGNAVAIGLITIASILNPFALMLFIPLAIVDFGIVAIFLILSIVLTILYWIYYIKEIGSLALIPLIMWGIGVLVSFIPYIGSILSSIINIMPWMAFVVILHYLTYRKKTLF